ncbi:hypothetical protein [Nonlabens xiamenensis]|uniref:hypothetical protein n=1 Tax=Nonlabens xiamenensis TaxID=2341043 RepID=UPI000F612618|nr:hypothetical protein [Nonlabens xiamenensis]
MKKKTISYLLIIFIVISCGDSKTDNDKEQALTSYEIDKNQEDSTLEVADHDSIYRNSEADFQSHVNSKVNIDSLITKYPPNQYSELRSHMEWLVEEWKNVPNPMTARYEGNDFGDYHHVYFKASNGINYDFGQANNNYGQFELHELSGHFIDNPAFLEQEFKVFWDWKLSKFLCCEGEYGEAEAYLPTITNLELIKK